MIPVANDDNFADAILKKLINEIAAAEHRSNIHDMRVTNSAKFAQRLRLAKLGLGRLDSERLESGRFGQAGHTLTSPMPTLPTR
jgi:hypothetical protein